MTKQNQSEIVKKINELYIMTRFKYLVQFPGGKYATLDQRKDNRIIPLNDSFINSHLKGERTYGIFSGGYFAKFITFDIDCEGHDETARWAVYKIIDILTTEHNIMRNDIHVSLSGNKGYHVDLFFDRPVLVEDLRKFYTSVTTEVGPLPVGKIEFRPTWSSGVKLPLGVHQKTGTRCWFVDRDTLEPVESFDYILDIKPMPAEIISEKDFELTDDQAAEFEEIIRTVDPNITIVNASDSLKRAKRILEAGRLTESNTRHTTTVILASFFNSQGWEKQDAIDAIMNILHNTPREYFNPDSTPDFWQKETERIVNLAFDRDYRLGNENKEIIIHKSEIKEVLKAETFRTKQVAFAMLITAKRYGRLFYFTYGASVKMIGIKSPNTFFDAVKRLEKSKFIKVVRRGEIDKAASREKGRIFKKPNKYRLLINEPAPDEPYVVIKPDDVDSADLVDITKSLLTEDEIKQHVKRYEYTKRWK